MGTLVNTLKLIRVINCLLAFLGVILGAHLTGQWVWLYPAIIAGVAALLVCAAGNVVNDICDIKIDRINRPDRVLVRQLLTLRYAWGVAITLTVFAVVLAATVNLKVVAIALFTIAALAAYDFRLKRVPLLGNMVIAFLGGLTFLTGAWAIDADVFGNPSGALVPAVFAFCLHLIREILKDVEDLDGDRRANVRTLPQVVGIPTAIRIAFALLVMLIVLTLVPTFMQWYRPAYTWLTILGIDLPLLIVMILVLRRPDRQRVRLGSTGLKIGMGLGLVALLLAS